MIDPHEIDSFFHTARERYNILEKRRKGLPGPWTDDPIFQQYRFCNTFREDDRTTIWFRDNIRENLRDDARGVLLATTIFRWFNRIETGEKIKYMLEIGAWSSGEARVLLEDQHPLVTGAYIIKTPNGKNKLDGILWCIEEFLAGLDECVAARDGSETIEGVWSALMTFPFLGSFMAYQICSDLMHTCWLDRAPDRYTWAAMGPGSTRGVGWLVGSDPGMFSLNSEKDCGIMRAHMQEISDASVGFWDRRWTMQEVQHWLCEHDKYLRAKGGQAQKRKFTCLGSGPVK